MKQYSVENSLAGTFLCKTGPFEWSVATDAIYCPFKCKYFYSKRRAKRWATYLNKLYNTTLFTVITSC